MLLAAASVSGWAQQWEFGGYGGAGFLGNVNVSSATSGSATAGFQPGFAAGAFFGQNLYSHLSGELHYTFMQSNLRLQSGGTEATFAGQSHAIHYDVILHTNKRESRVQYFAAIGGGARIFRGTGQEQAFQPLSQFGYFTKTQTIKPMASVGGGLKYALTSRVFLRLELRDYITPFPTQVITPAPGAKFGSILNELVPMVTVSYEH